MIAKRTHRFDRYVGDDVERWEIGVYRGWDDWRLGIYVERHERETQVSFHVPCLSLHVQVNR